MPSGPGSSPSHHAHHRHGGPHQPPPSAIGNYPVERELGRGGMGVVYLARDTRLNRQVAIKVLPPAVAADPVRLARFEREARSLAALNHPYVGQIYGLEEAEGQRLLVLEYIPGEALSKRLQRGAMPADEALRVCVQIAEGLEAAHDRALIHRDLKPDNVRITPEGVAKILDFGLATSDPGQTAASTSAGTAPSLIVTGPTPLDGSTAEGADLSAPTVSGNLTQVGAVMGTPGYMSPEQARGVPLDKRTDIWAFGCVLFECLTGARAFWGQTVAECIAAVLDREPEWSLLPPIIPPRIREVLRRCLTKDPRRRLRDAGDARLELEDVLALPMSSWGRAAVEALGPAAAPVRARALARLTLPLPAGWNIANTARCAVAIAPDGGTVAFIAVRAAPAPSSAATPGQVPAGPTPAAFPPAPGAQVTPDVPAVGQAQLFIRRLDAEAPMLIPGATAPDGPFFSPDATRLGFFDAGKLKIVSISGGAVGVPVALADAPRPQGAVWDASDHILYIPDWQHPLVRIRALGGAPEVAVQPDSAGGETALLAPEALPAARHALVAGFSAAGGAGAGGAGFDQCAIIAADVRPSTHTGSRKPLFIGGCNPRYAASGHIVVSRGGGLCALAFDPDRLDIGPGVQPTPVLDGVMGNALGGASHYAIAHEGTLVYAPGRLAETENELIALPRQATAAAAGPAQAAAPPGPEATLLSNVRRGFSSPALSPDGARLAVLIQSTTDQLWLFDLARGTSMRLSPLGDCSAPVWSPDGARVAHRAALASGGHAVVLTNADGSGASQTVLTGDATAAPAAFSPDGRTLIFTRARKAGGSGARAGGSEICALTIGENTPPRRVVDPASSAWSPALSPDGRYLAYCADAGMGLGGRSEIFVQVFNPQQIEGASAPRWQVTAEGGAAPVWARSGGELYYRAGSALIAVRIAVEPTFMAGRPRTVARAEGCLPATPAAANYGVYPDGQRFVFVRAGAAAGGPPSLNIILNWFEELRRRVPPLSTSRTGFGSRAAMTPTRSVSAGPAHASAAPQHPRSGTRFAQPHADGPVSNQPPHAATPHNQPPFPPNTSAGTIG